MVQWIQHLILFEERLELLQPERQSRLPSTTRRASEAGEFTLKRYGGFHKWDYPQMDG